MYKRWKKINKFLKGFFLLRKTNKKVVKSYRMRNLKVLMNAKDKLSILKAMKAGGLNIEDIED